MPPSSSSSSSRRRPQAQGKAQSTRNGARGGKQQQAAKVKPQRPSQQRRGPQSSSSSSSSSSSPSLSSDFIDDFHAEATLARSHLLDQAMAEAEELMGQADYSSALALLLPLVSSHPTSSSLHDLVGQCHLAEGDVDSALAHLTTSCQLAPSDNPIKWMYIAQIKGGMEAIEAFQRGVEVYKRQKEELSSRRDSGAAAAATTAGGAEMDTREEQQGKSDADGSGGEGDEVEAELRAVRHSLSSAYVSMSELYVTDCCDEEDAEEQCEALLSQAVEEWPDNPEALYCTAQLRLIQGDEGTAKEWMRRAITAVQRAHQSDSARQPALTVLSSLSSSSSSHLPSPSYELRLNLAKLSYELGEWAASGELLHGCVEEDDHFIETHHLLALVHLQQNKPTQARESAERAMTMARKAVEAGEATRQDMKGTMTALSQVIQQCEGREDEPEEDGEEEEGEENDNEEEVGEGEEDEDDADDDSGQPGGDESMVE